jgi:hypothetical protein
VVPSLNRQVSAAETGHVTNTTHFLHPGTVRRRRYGIWGVPNRRRHALIIKSPPQTHGVWGVPSCRRHSFCCKHKGLNLHVEVQQLTSYIARSQHQRPCEKRVGRRIATNHPTYSNRSSITTIADQQRFVNKRVVCAAVRRVSGIYAPSKLLWCGISSTLWARSFA